MQRILLASHGTTGARAAEQAVLVRLKPGDRLYHLMVVPDSWDGMLDDDGLDNTGHREAAAEHIEARLEEEVRLTLARVSEAVQQMGVVYESRLVYSKPVYALLDAVAAISPDYVIAGSSRPKHKQGMPSKMITESLMRSMVIPLLIIPYPDERF